MAFDVQDVSYSGRYSSHFITPALYNMDTINKGLCHIVGDIGKMYTIGRIDYKNPLKPNEAVPTTDNDNPFILDGRTLIPKSVEVYEEYNPRDLEQNQLADRLSTTILDREVPQDLQSQMIQLLLNRTAEKYEDHLWMGSLDYAGVAKSDPRFQLQFFDGWMRRMVNDPLVNLSTVSPVAITANNIFTIMNDLKSEATKKKKGLVTEKDRFRKMKYLMSPLSAEIYTEALATGTSFKGIALDVGYLPKWAGYTVESVAGMPDDTILFLRATDEFDNTNLFAGCNSMEDWQVKNQRTLPKNETFFILAKFKWDVQYGWGDEIFMYTTLTAADFLQ